jgi:hypothetical protein
MLLKRINLAFSNTRCRSGGMADAPDSKCESFLGKSVPAVDTRSKVAKVMISPREKTKGKGGIKTQQKTDLTVIRNQ